jgi:hypothetical protein
MQPGFAHDRPATTDAEGKLWAHTRQWMGGRVRVQRWIWKMPGSISKNRSPRVSLGLRSSSELILIGAVEKTGVNGYADF